MPVTPTNSSAESCLGAVVRVVTRITANLDRQGVIESLADGLVADLGIDLARIWLYDPADGALHLRARAGATDLIPEYGRRWTLQDRQVPIVRAILAGEPLVIPDVRAVEGFLPADLGPEWVEEAGLHAYAGLPLMVAGRPCGGMSVYRHEPFSPELLQALEVLAQQAALTIEQARLGETMLAAQAAAIERAQERAALLEVAAALTSTLDLAPLLDRILDQLLKVLAYRSAGVFLVRGDVIETVAGRDGKEPERARRNVGQRRPLVQMAPIWQTILLGQPMVIGDVRRDDDPLAAAWRTVTSNLHALPATLPVRAWMAVPLTVRGHVTGYLALTREEPDSFRERDIELAAAFAGHAALAMDNARLYAQSRELASLEERARLARDLHDSVTQSVFSAGMLADAALTQHQRGSAALPATLERIRTVLGEALGEMRALLYELQPAALSEEGLERALEKLAAAVQARLSVPVQFSGTLTRRLSPETETAIFRIVQEALANAAKYAQAGTIRLTLREEQDLMRACVEDDGIGFDPAVPVHPSADGRRGGMGLRSMRERAAAAGLSLLVESTPGSGTRVSVEAPLSPPAGSP